MLYAAIPKLRPKFSIVPSNRPHARNHLSLPTLPPHMVGYTKSHLYLFPFHFLIYLSPLSQFLSRFYSLSFPRSSCRDGALPEGAVVTRMATS